MKVCRCIAVGGVGIAGVVLASTCASAATWTGSDGNDDYPGTSVRDVVDGLGGQDFLLGNSGDDVIGGGFGNDGLNGQLGDDSLFGGPGQDTLAGEAGNDYLSGGDGSDVVVMSGGRETVNGGSGDDEIVVVKSADGLADTVVCGPGADIVTFVQKRDPADEFSGCDHYVYLR